MFVGYHLFKLFFLLLPSYGTLHHNHDKGPSSFSLLSIIIAVVNFFVDRDDWGVVITGDSGLLGVNRLGTGIDRLKLVYLPRVALE